MKTELRRLATGLVNAITRGKVARAVIGPRTMMQVTGLDQEVAQGVELALPPGYSARPAPGADLVLLQVGGVRGHLVAVGGDAVGGGIADLAEGEVGIRFAGRQIVLRVDRIEITSDLPVIVTAPEIHLGGTGGKKLALDGDPVSGGTVQASATKVWGQ